MLCTITRRYIFPIWHAPRMWALTSSRLARFPVHIDMQTFCLQTKAVYQQLKDSAWL